MWAVSGMLLVTTGQARAQSADLTRLMPEETLLYLGWAGHDHTSIAARDTAMGKLIAEPQVRRFLDQLYLTADTLLEQQAAGQNGWPGYASAKRVLSTLYKRPTAIGVVDLGMTEQGPGIQLALVSHVGDSGDAFLGAVDTLLEFAGLPPGMPVTVAGKSLSSLPLPVPGGVYYGLVGDYFIFAVGEATVAAVVERMGTDAPSLAHSSSLELSRRKIGGTDATRAWTFYADLAAVYERVQMFLPMILQGNLGDVEELPRLLSTFGVDNLKSLCWEMHHRDGGCRNSIYLHTSGSREGLLALLPDTPITDADLSFIPRSASWATVYNISLGRIYPEAMSVLKSMDHTSYAETAEMITDMEAKIGLKLGPDILDLIGDTVIFYDQPGNGGFWLTGITAVIESPDTTRLRSTIRTLVKAIEEEVGSTPIKVSSFDHRDHKVEFVNVVGVPMPIAPAWTAHDGRLIVGLFPQIVITALDRLLDGTPERDSILANSDFRRARKVLGGVGSMLGYVDTKAGVGNLYPLALPMAQVGAAMAQGEGVDVNVSAVPTIDAVTKHLFAHVTTSRVDDDGILFVAYGPLPMAVPSIGAGGMELPLMASILLPSLARARELAKRTVSAANLKGVGVSCLIYANEHNELFPPDLQTLVEDGSITPAQLESPKRVRGRECYVYVVRQGNGSDPRNILAYERRDLNDGEGVNVLFVDSSVRFVRMDEFEKLLAATEARLDSADLP